jgi:hypothetical protein
MSGGEIAVFVVACVTAVLFVVAIWEAHRTTREAKNTTKALDGVQKFIERQLSEIQETTNQIRETKDAIRQQSEAMYVAQLWFKWESPEMRHSINFGLELVNRAAAKSLWDASFHEGRNVADAALEVPRFFDDLIGNLLNLGSIREETALANFGFNADHYWKRFKPLIELLREDATWGYYRFYYFERFAIKAADYLAKREAGDS